MRTGTVSLFALSWLLLCACPSKQAPAEQTSSQQTEVNPQTGCRDQPYGKDLEVTTGAQLADAGLYPSIKGALVIKGTDLVKPPELKCLSSVQQLIVDGNPNLRHPHGLSSVTSIEGDLTISNNPSLTSLRGFEKLAFVGGKVSVIDCPKLTDCEAYFLLQRLRAKRRDLELDVRGNLSDQCSNKIARMSAPAGPSSAQSAPAE